MMRALKNVNDKAAAGTLTFDDMSDLRYYSAKYFKKREGIFFSPRTDNGKDRLMASGDIYNLSSAVIDNHVRNAGLEIQEAPVNQGAPKKKASVTEEHKKKPGKQLGP